MRENVGAKPFTLLLRRLHNIKIEIRDNKCCKQPDTKKQKTKHPPDNFIYILQDFDHLLPRGVSEKARRDIRATEFKTERTEAGTA